MKQCTMCKEWKDESAYWKAKEGKLRAACKSCKYKQHRKYIKLHPEERKEYSKRNYYKNIEHTRAVKRDVAKRYRPFNMEKERAHAAVKRALACGLLTKPNKCSICGSNKRIQAHHGDYKKLVIVEWLCHKCHVLKHYN